MNSVYLRHHGCSLFASSAAQLYNNGSLWCIQRQRPVSWAFMTGEGNFYCASRPACDITRTPRVVGVVLSPRRLVVYTHYFALCMCLLARMRRGCTTCHWRRLRCTTARGRKIKCVCPRGSHACAMTAATTAAQRCRAEACLTGWPQGALLVPAPFRNTVSTLSLSCFIPT